MAARTPASGRTAGQHLDGAYTGSVKLTAAALLAVVLYAAALELVPWPWPAVLAVPASIATVLAVVLIGAPVFLPGYLIPQ